ncbi:MAG: hypothetical protein MK312_14745, partial [Roseibacillus sp.]|nr:hypothetical protein [Roseibacillus sp.]
MRAGESVFLQKEKVAKMDMPLLDLKDVTVWRGDRKVFDGLSLQIESQERVAVLGPHGAGIRSLLSLVSGDIHAVGDE